MNYAGVQWQAKRIDGLEVRIMNDFEQVFASTDGLVVHRINVLGAFLLTN